MATIQSEKTLEVKVGAFVVVGLAVLAALVVQFGRVGEGFKTYYALTIRFPDASGLLKGSDVLLAGAKIGRVSDGPRLAQAGQGVEVPLRIYDYVRIPAGSKFTVGSSGLLGDRFVAVTMPPGQPTAFMQKNIMIEGTRETGLDDLTREGGFLVSDLRGTVQNVNATVSRLNEQALSSENMQNLKGTVEHLNQATAALAESSKKIDGVLEKADATMGSAKKAADDVQAAIVDARKTIQAATQVMQEATSGKGLLPALLSNQELAKDLRALVSNLRAHGILFYRDSAAKAETRAAPERSPTPLPRKTGGR
ncbi:MAG: phospholipid/cholesterol/gamma-HCH transport system substrate-binding protein [Verrucomicrobiota bacterium]|jgi:phospholipid/cholesterol/gamma-HCH transport system substrate-binding protein